MRINAPYRWRRFIFMPKLVIFQNRGFTLTRRESHDCEMSGGGRRGEITGSSSASFRRFRSFCMKYYVPECEMFGVTLTVPGVELVSYDGFRNIWHRFSRWAAKRRLPVIWRIELQQRGQPHVHAIVFGSTDDVLCAFGEWYRCIDVDTLSHEVCGNRADIISISRAFLRGSNYAVQFVRLSDSHQAFRYLVSHASKGKVEQLGYVGRQWGVVSRDIFRPVAGSIVELDDVEYYSVVRWLRRLTRCRINSRAGCSSWLCNPDTVRRMIFFLRGECHRGKIDTWKLP